MISGFCKIGRRSYLGVNSSVRDELSIAEDCVIGAGAVVVKDAYPAAGNDPLPGGQVKDAYAVGLRWPGSRRVLDPPARSPESGSSRGQGAGSVTPRTRDSHDPQALHSDHLHHRRYR